MLPRRRQMPFGSRTAKFDGGAGVRTRTHRRLFPRSAFAGGRQVVSGDVMKNRDRRWDGLQHPRPANILAGW